MAFQRRDGVFRLGDPPPRRAVERLGAKGADLARAAATDPTLTPRGVILDSALCAEILADGAPSEALVAALGADPALAGAAVSLRLSPETQLPDLAPGLLGVGGGDPEAETALAESGARYGGAPVDLAAAIAVLLEAWRAPRAARRRLALGAEERCALIIHPFIAAERRFDDLNLYDLETGAPVASVDPAAAVIARRVEEAVGAPLELDLAVPRGAQTPVMLCARPFPGGAEALVAASVGMAEAGRIDRDAALLAVPADRVEELLHAQVEDSAGRPVLGRGLAASPGAASGRLAFDSDEAAAFAKSGEPAILARQETTPEDVHGMSAAAGVLTARGGLTSHAAVVARGMGLPAVVGALDLRLETDDADTTRLRAVDGRLFASGDWITLDARQGLVLEGRATISRAAPSGALKVLMGWADARRRMRVRANADTPQEVESAMGMGVDGVGLCRTEHMFFAPERITAMRRMIMADEEEERREALERLLPMQRADFEQVFEIVTRFAGREAPATIRLLDPPLHEFLPRDARGFAALAAAIDAPVEKVARRALDLREDNPMLGKRGCRVGVAYPEIYEMQARAIFEAAAAVAARLDPGSDGVVGPRIEIMVPLVSAARELELLRGRIDAVAAAVEAELGRRLDYGVGIMVETPRAALRADALGPLSTFFSFGTNDLTQMTYGLSRDDAGRLMRTYVERGVFEADPFASLDQEGVGELIRIGVERGRAANPELVIGMCGEHGGDAATISFCERVGFDYVSCSPYRAPIARLAAAQAAIALGSEEADGGV